MRNGSHSRRVRRRTQTGRARQHRRSLRSKLLAYYLPLVACAVVAVFAVTEWHYLHTQRADLRLRLDRGVQLHVAPIATSMWEYDFQQVQATVSAMALYLPDVKSVTVVDAAGDVVARSGDSQAVNVRRDLVREAPLLRTFDGTEERLGTLILEGHDETLRATLFEHLRQSALMFVALLASLVAATVLVSRQVLDRPLALLRSAIARTGEGAQPGQVDWDSDDELGELIASYNDVQAARWSAEQALREHQATLEQQVAERTMALELARRDALAAADAKSTFLASMSHEIRTPMNGILGMAELLAKSGLDRDQRTMLGTLRDSGESLLTIINDILDFSKIEAGKLEIEAIPVSLVDTAETVAASLAPSAAVRDVRIVVHVHASLPRGVLGDRVRLRQILLNLAGNAIKFSSEGEDISIVVRPAPVAEGTPSRYQLVVNDCGIGMSEQTVDSLFTPFTQAESSTTRKYGGTGLGLSICRRLADLMDGEIHVHSELGSGSTFTVTLPLVAAELPSAPVAVTRLDGLRVLCVDRNATSRAAVCEALELAGASASACPPGQALDHARREAFAAVVFADPRDHALALSLAAEGSDEGRAKIIVGRTRLAGDGGADVSNGMHMVDADPLRRDALLVSVAKAVGRAVGQAQQEVAAAASPELVRSAPAANAPRLLVAEDNRINRMVIGRQLEALGYRFDFGHDGVQALSMWRSNAYDALLTDCDMPNMDGFDLTAAIRAVEGHGACRMPIIAITANALQGEAERCLAAGMDDYLSKPVELGELERKLRRWTEAESGTSGNA